MGNKDWRGVIETGVNKAVKSNVLARMSQVMGSKSEGARGFIHEQRDAMKPGGSKKARKRFGGDNSVGNTRCMITQERNIAEIVISRDPKSAEANGNMEFAFIDTKKANGSRMSLGIRLVAPKELTIRSSGGLRTGIKMSLQSRRSTRGISAKSRDLQHLTAAAGRMNRRIITGGRNIIVGKGKGDVFRGTAPRAREFTLSWANSGSVSSKCWREAVVS